MNERANWLPEIDHDPVPTEPVVALPAEPGTIRYAAVRGVLELLEMVAARNKVSLDELLSRNRTWPVTKARSDAILTLLDLGHSQSEVARVLGIDHSTVGYHARGSKK